MKTFYLILICLWCFTAKAQTAPINKNKTFYALINDTNGFVNIRSEKSSNSPVSGKLIKNELFSCTPNNSDWWAVYCVKDFERNNLSYIEEGFVHRNKIISLNNAGKFVNSKYVNKDSCVFHVDGIKAVVTQQAFDNKKHSLTYNKPKTGERNITKVIEKIDGAFYWGTDGGVPKTGITSLKVTLNGHNVIIPKAAWANLYQPNLNSLQVSLQKNNIILIEMNNSDGAGAYTIIWIIKDGKYISRYIDNSGA